MPDMEENREMGGIGVDIVEIRRFRDAKNLERVAELICTRKELDEFYFASDPFQFLASRFAAKEAVIKAYPEVLTYRDIEIYKIGKKPHVRLKTYPHAKVRVSISHSLDYAVGLAIT